MKEELRSSRTVFEGRLLKVRVDEVELPGGGEAQREVLVHPGAVALLALDDEGRLLLVRQYRHAAGRSLLELPAGTLEEGEPPEACARRELEEETGHRPGRLEPLISFFPSPGVSSEIIHLFLASELLAVESGPEEDEQLELVRLTPEEALRRMDAGEVADAKTIAGLCLLRERLRP